MTEGYYASSEWYQPRAATTYTLVQRYGKSDYIGAYCFQGAGSTSYFQAPEGAVMLTGAVELAASVIALGSAFYIAM